jgi:hypothetical protein
MLAVALIFIAQLTMLATWTMRSGLRLKVALIVPVFMWSGFGLIRGSKLAWWVLIYFFSFFLSRWAGAGWERYTAGAATDCLSWVTLMYIVLCGTVMALLLTDPPSHWRKYAPERTRPADNNEF